MMTEPDDDDRDDDDYDEERECFICGGEGYVYGDTLGDPLWYDADTLYRCTSCRGSGLRKDMTWM
jgi:hypothetical protein